MIFIIHSRIPSDGNQTKTAVCWLPLHISLALFCMIYFSGCMCCMHETPFCSPDSCMQGNNFEWGAIQELSYSVKLFNNDVIRFYYHRPPFNYGAVNNWRTKCDLLRNVLVARLLLSAACRHSWMQLTVAQSAQETLVKLITTQAFAD